MIQRTGALSGRVSVLERVPLMSGKIRGDAQWNAQKKIRVLFRDALHLLCKHTFTSNYQFVKEKFNTSLFFILFMESEKYAAEIESSVANILLKRLKIMKN